MFPSRTKLVRQAGEGAEVVAIAAIRVRSIEGEDEEAEVETAFLMESILKMSITRPPSNQVSEVEVAAPGAITIVMSVKRSSPRPKPLITSSDKAELNSSSKRRGKDKPMTMTPEGYRSEIIKKLQMQRIWPSKAHNRWAAARIILGRARGPTRILELLASISIAMMTERFMVKRKFNSCAKVIDMPKIRSRLSTTTRTS